MDSAMAYCNALRLCRGDRATILSSIGFAGTPHQPLAVFALESLGPFSLQREIENIVRQQARKRNMVKVIFACIHNAGRSQMAAAFFNRLVDPTKAIAVSAGTDPGMRVHPEVLAAMQEIGIDLSCATPQKLTFDLARDAQLLITMGCGDQCPYVPGVRRDDWPLRDPKGRPVDEVRSIRDEIKARVQSLLGREGLNGTQ